MKVTQNDSTLNIKQKILLDGFIVHSFKIKKVKIEKSSIAKKKFEGKFKIYTYKEPNKKTFRKSIQIKDILN